jgi:hypothetical protein
VNGTDAGTGQHGKCRFGNHGHVDQHAVALLHTQILEHSGHSLHLGMQFTEGVHLLYIGLGGNKDQC